MDFLVDLFGTRDPYKGEISFFKGRPEVAGMATEDNKIILNPFSKNSPEEQRAVATNEAIRLYMKMKDVQPSFDLTESQQKFFKGTEYEKDPLNARRTLLARILTNDPSVGIPTDEQKKTAEELMQQIQALQPSKK